MSQAVPIEMMGVQCTQCALAFAIPRAMYDAAVAGQTAFCCPRGHKVVLGRPAPIDQLITAHEAKVKQLQEDLLIEQTMTTRLSDNVGRLARENAKLACTIVDVLVGAATREEER